jgi:hypothetical protein
MKNIFLKFFPDALAKPRFKAPGTLEGTFEYRNGRITGELVDRHDLKESAISVLAMREEKPILSAKAERIGNTNRYRFEMPLNNAFSPADFVSEKVTIIARSPLGATGTLRLDGASGLELIREYFSAAAETLCDIDFTKGGNSRDYLGKGWSGQEQDYTWTEDENSFLRLPTLTHPGQHALRLVTGALINKPFVSSQFMQLFLNGELIDTQSINEGAAQFYEAKFAGEPFCSQPLELRIHHPDAARPCDISQTSKDSRRLALAVKRLTLVRFLAPGT